MFKQIIGLLVLSSVLVSGAASAKTRAEALNEVAQCGTNVAYAESVNGNWSAVCVADDSSQSDACNDVAGRLDCSSLSRYECTTTIESIYNACMVIGDSAPGTVHWSN